MLLRFFSQGYRIWAFAVVLLFVVIVTFIQYQLVRLEESRNALEAMVARLQLANNLLADERASKVTGRKVEDDTIVIYNRVPKTASTSFVNVAYDLCKRNGFNVLHLNVTGNLHVMPIPDQARFVYNVTHWNAKKPGLYHGHVAFIDFDKFGSYQRPVYINLLRKPLDRLVSYYYFLRFGDNYRPHLIRRKHGDKMVFINIVETVKDQPDFVMVPVFGRVHLPYDVSLGQTFSFPCFDGANWERPNSFNQTFDDCVKRKQSDCDPENMWLQIPFLCGHLPKCWEPGNQWALDQAKHNLATRYLVVGVTEQLQEFISVLEATLPTFFRGAVQHFKSSKKSHLRKTNLKLEPSNETVAEIMQSKVWKMEMELYNYAVDQFEYIKKKMGKNRDGLPFDRGQQFMFEKISPKQK